MLVLVLHRGAVTVSSAGPRGLFEVNVKWFSVASPGLLGILRKTQFLRYYSVREPN